LGKKSRGGDISLTGEKRILTKKKEGLAKGKKPNNGGNRKTLEADRRP